MRRSMSISNLTARRPTSPHWSRRCPLTLTRPLVASARRARPRVAAPFAQSATAAHSHRLAAAHSEASLAASLPPPRECMARGRAAAGCLLGSGCRAIAFADRMKRIVGDGGGARLRWTVTRSPDAWSAPWAAARSVYVGMDVRWVGLFTTGSRAAFQPEDGPGTRELREPRERWLDPLAVLPHASRATLRSVLRSAAALVVAAGIVRRHRRYLPATTRAGRWAFAMRAKRRLVVRELWAGRAGIPAALAPYRRSATARTLGCDESSLRRAIACAPRITPIPNYASHSGTFARQPDTLPAYSAWPTSRAFGKT